jgi:hypothetical protein
MRSLHAVLAAPPDGSPLASSEGFWERHRAASAVGADTVDQAILGGFSADRVAYAFASGYQAALRAIFPDLPPERPASLCVTERGGGHPSAIETRLERQGDHYRVTGRKRWATLAGEAGVLLVLASAGIDGEGRKILRLAKILGSASGVQRQPMPEAPFAPEIAHDEIELSGVTVAEADLYPGDGYARYVRPFRTIEDIHVTAAILAYLVREVRLHRLPEVHAERLAALLVALHALSSLDPSAPSTHVALAGLVDLVRAPLDDLDRVWKKTESPAHARWERDRLILSVSTSVREKRRIRAWERLAAATTEEEESTGGEALPSSSTAT